ncbi:hypothetical protein BY458DRAFT_503708 [Sporodiniella umbellata]|nr:hypothetical protein BY458DRAFT_503708 [Sporodiniella umbellata]
MTRLEGMHFYVEVLLKVARESYKRNMGKEEAQEILHTFAIMKCSESSDDELSNSDDKSDTDEREEERNYLGHLQNHIPIRRPPSVGSIQTMVTAPGTPRQLPLLRPPSALSMPRSQHGRDVMLSSFDEEERMSTNPWAAQQSRERSSVTPTSSLRLSSPSIFSSLPPVSATHQAIEILKKEMATLNKRIDDLRIEIVERDRKSIPQPEKVEPIKDGEDDGWKWVIKAALKYAGVNFMTVLILFLALYKIKSPIAFAVLEQISKVLHPLRPPI